MNPAFKYLTHDIRKSYSMPDPFATEKELMCTYPLYAERLFPHFSSYFPSIIYLARFTYHSNKNSSLPVPAYS